MDELCRAARNWSVERADVDFYLVPQQQLHMFGGFTGHRLPHKYVVRLSVKAMSLIAD
jgi:hypothetical protein